MSSFELLSFATDQELASDASRRWLELLSAREKRGAFCVALSGGRIARRFCMEVAERAKAQPALLAEVHFFWGDERCVPPTDPESNYGLARELLLAPAGIVEGRIHRIRGEDAPEAAAIAAEEELRRVAPSDAEGQPMLDLILLGMGEDGHVASLFPGEKEGMISNPAVYRAVTAVKPPPRRITLGYKGIAAARNVWVLSSGPGKERAFRESTTPGGLTPLARVIAQRAHTTIFTDIRA